MSDPEPIDLSQLQNLNLAPDWVGDLQKREMAPGEVVWGRAPDHERESRGGGFGFGTGGKGGPRREGGGFGGRSDFNRQDRGGPPRGPRPDDRGPRPAGPRSDDRGPRPAGPRPDDRGPRPDRPPGDRGPRPGGPRFEDRGPRPGGPRPDDRGPRPGGPDRRGGGRPDFRGDDRRGGSGRFEDRPYIEPLAGWRVRLFAEPKSLEAITRQVKASGRAYPVFELGRLFLAGRDRYVVNFSRLPAPQVPRGPKGAAVPEVEPLGGPEHLFHVPADGSLWLSRDEAIRHILHGPSLQQYYRRETISVDPPKGIFTAVAVCGFSGEILGPPNHHSFQTTVARLHREKFYNLPLDRYKSRIRSEKDEALVAKWLEGQSSAQVYVPLSPREMAEQAAAPKATPAPAPPAEAEAPAEVVPADEASEAVAASEAPAESAGEAAPQAVEAPEADVPAGEASPAVESEGEAAPAEEVAPAAEPLRTQAAMEAHFMEHHAAHAVKAVSRVSVPGNIPGRLLAPPLLALLRMEVEQQQRFPMQLVQDLCRDLEKESLKFFKRDKKATFVCRTRPHFIEDESHLSPRLRSIVGVVKANPGITVPKLVSTLAPHVEAPAAKAPKPTEGAPEPGAPEPVAAEVAAEPVPAAVEAAPAAEVPAVEVPEAVAAFVAEAPASVEVAPAASPQGVETQDSAQTLILSEVVPPAAEPAAAPAAAEPAAVEPAGAEPAAAGEGGRGRRSRGPRKPAAPTGPPTPLTAEEIVVLQDLRWLVQEGYVTEYASGELQVLGRAPQPPMEKKVRPEAAPGRAPRAAAEGPGGRKAPAGEAPAGAAAESAAAAEPAVGGDAVVSEGALAAAEATPVAEAPAVEVPEVAEVALAVEALAPAGEAVAAEESAAGEASTDAAAE